MHNSTFEDEMSLGAFLLGLKDLLKGILRHWLSLLICLIAGLAISFILSRKHVPHYTASLSFMLSDDGNQMSSVNSIFGQLGLPVSGGKYNIDKLMQISRSRTIVQAALFQYAVIGGQEDFLANHLIDQHDLRSRWQKDDRELGAFRFAHNRLQDFNDTENLILKRLYHLITGSDRGGQDGLLIADYGRDHYVMSFDVKTMSEPLSIALAKALYAEVVLFYSKTFKETKQNTYVILESKRDSIRSQLTSVEYKLARLKDRSLGTFSNESSLAQSQLRTQSVILTAALAEAEKNLGLAQFSLESSTPLVQLIDEPIPPLMPSEFSVIKLLVVGAGLGIVLFVGFHLGRFVIE